MHSHFARNLPASLVVLLSSCLTCASTGRALAATYYVDNTNPSSTDAGPGTPATPYRTIGAALTQRGGPGNTVRVLAGTYREQVTLGVNGASGSPCVVEAASAAVVIDGADDFTSLAQWTLVSGNVWRASSVTWSPLQAFADGARLTASTVTPAIMPTGTFQYVAGAGLYVNAGGGNPAGHGARVGRRQYGFTGAARAWITVRGFTIVRQENKAVYLSGGSSNCEVTDCRISFAHSQGIQFNGVTASRIARCIVSQNGDHGIGIGGGTTGCTVEDNDSSNNFYPPARQANGIDLFGSPGNLVQRNRFHHNQDTGLNLRAGSNNNLCANNLSWSNGDHGVDNLTSTGNTHINTVTWGNYRDGFSIEGTSTGTQLFNCIGVDNGLTTSEYNLWVDPGSASGFVSNDNVFWNSNGQSPVKFGLIAYLTVSTYAAASGRDSRSLHVDPLFVNAAAGDFHLRSGSRAIDSGNSGAANWPALDAEGRGRFDDPATANSGLGPVGYSDRGALEYINTSTPAAPTAALTVTPSSGVAPLSVTANASGSTDPDGTIVSYRFDFGDGVVVGPQAGATATHTYALGTWTASVRVTDNSGRTGTTSRVVTVTPDRPPVVTATASATVNENAQLSFTVTASDPDGQPIGSLVADFSGLPAGHTATFVPGSGNTSGTFSWKPSYSDSGSWSVTFRATANGLQAARTTAIKVVNVDRAPVLTAPGTVKVSRGTIAIVDVAVSDSDGDAITSLTANLSALPAGNNARFVPGPGNTTGRLTWTTRSIDRGRYDVPFTAANGQTRTVTTTIQVMNNAQNSGTAAAAPEVPGMLSLSPPTPNPAGRVVAFRLGLPQESAIEWSVIDIQGREVWRQSETRGPGWSNLEWDGRTLAGRAVGSGVFLVRVRVGHEQTFVRRFARL